MSFTVIDDGSDGYTKLDPDATGDYLMWISQNFHTAATLAPSYAKSGAANTFTGDDEFTGSVTIDGLLTAFQALFTYNSTDVPLIVDGTGASATTRALCTASA